MSEEVIQAKIATINLGALDNIYFYLILDNVKAILKIERQKKIIEKLSISQSLVEPTCYSIILINDALQRDIDVFGKETNVFGEYGFFFFYFSPMSEDQVKRLMLETLKEMFMSDESRPNFAIDSKYLEFVFTDFFNLVYNQASTYTVTVNEFAYLCIFLYPNYMEPVYHASGLLATSESNTREEIIKKIDQIVAKRGNTLGHRTFRGLMAECLSNLYIHSTSKEDILRNVEERNQDE